MTIRIYAKPHALIPSNRVRGAVVIRDEDWHTLATADTAEEAEQAQRAFENVLAPRFTRDEAIAIVKPALEAHHAQGPDGWPEIAATARVVLEALAARGVFVDGRNMADKLDRAGIR